MPRMYGRNTSGTTIEPSAWRRFSTIAAHTHGTARAEPFSVWTSCGALLALDPVPDVGTPRLVVAEPADRRHLQPLVAAGRVHLDVEAAMVALAHVAGADLDDAVRQLELGDGALGPPDHLVEQTRRLIGVARARISTLSNSWERSMPRVSRPAEPASRRNDGVYAINRSGNSDSSRTSSE